MSCRVYENFPGAIEGVGGEEVGDTAIRRERLFIVGRDGYEGGEEVWDCSADLSVYIETTGFRRFLEQPVLRVLELGCGAAEPATTLARVRACAGLYTQLYLQEKDRAALDFTRKSVLSQITEEESNHILLNLFPSDWNSMTMLIDESRRFDVILMSETLYKAEVFEVITQIIDNLLKPNVGVCLSAQKLFYFGVGGGSLPYREYLRKNGALSVTVLRKIEGDGAPVRDITLLRHL